MTNTRWTDFTDREVQVLTDALGSADFDSPLFWFPEQRQMAAAMQEETVEECVARGLLVGADRLPPSYYEKEG